MSIIIGSAEALPILCVRYARWERERERDRQRERERERERERAIDGSDVIIVALKLAMSLHFPMPKIRTIAVIMSSHFPLPKNRTFRFSLHTSCLTIVALKFAVHTFRCQKIRPLCSDSLLNGASRASRATSDRKPKTNDSAQSYSSSLPYLTHRATLPAQPNWKSFKRSQPPSHASLVSHWKMTDGHISLKNGRKHMWHTKKGGKSDKRRRCKGPWHIAKVEKRVTASQMQ